MVYANVSGHYLQVVTTAGTCLVLMRLSDAVLALGDAGMQVHRSYWVSHRHIDGVDTTRSADAAAPYRVARDSGQPHPSGQRAGRDRPGCPQGHQCLM